MVHGVFRGAHDQRTSYKVTQQRSGLIEKHPSDSDGRSIQQTIRDEKHICYGVLESRYHEHYDGEPESHDFAGSIPRGKSEHHRHTNESVGRDSTQENVDPSMALCLAVCEIANKGQVRFLGEKFRFVGKQDGACEASKEICCPNDHKIDQGFGRWD